MINPFTFVKDYYEMRRILRTLCRVHLRYPEDPACLTMIELGAKGGRCNFVSNEDWVLAWRRARKHAFGVEERLP